MTQNKISFLKFNFKKSYLNGWSL